MPSFTIRDAIWLALVVTLGLGWWMDHYEQQRLIKSHEESLAPKSASTKAGA
jgi:hypothetical protein